MATENRKWLTSNLHPPLNLFIANILIWFTEMGFGDRANFDRLWDSQNLAHGALSFSERG